MAKVFPTDIPADLKPRFWAKVDVRGPDECWEWNACRGSSGYGIFRFDRRNWIAHRLALQWALGRPITSDEYACHHCDNRCCVNPRHLFLGDAQSNIDDAAAKGRLNRGEKVPNSLLTEEAVREIRRLYDGGGITMKAIARQFGVRKSTVVNVLCGYTWKHVT